ncbi:MAG: ADP-ribosylglycohydrolase family protein [Verrucomicrobiales bacterium]|nr:ADP-ribosylglycohydrolase family protein [Verrucomicrobiales bacterium]
MMLGAIAGDIIGSIFESKNIKHADFEPLFQINTTWTDDTVLTLATADLLTYGGTYADVYQIYGCRYPFAGYGGSFFEWMKKENPAPYNSWGNGAGMRVSPIGWARDSVDEVLAEAERSAEVTHNHPEGIKGAKAIALAVYLARTGVSKEKIRREIEDRFEYNLSRTLDEIRPKYGFDVSCQGSVPEAIIAFLESTDFESAIRLAISIGGDSDTIACMAGSIAQAHYGKIPAAITDTCREKLHKRLLPVLDEFCEKYPDVDK